MLILFSCKEKTKSDLSADEIINKAIEVSGGNLYKSSKISFSFRNKDYVSENSGTILKRSFKIDSIKYTDVKNNSGFERYINDALVLVSDSLASLYSNSINSVLLIKKEEVMILKTHIIIGFKKSRLSQII